jgi:hypothetical protein
MGRSIWSPMMTSSPMASNFHSTAGSTSAASSLSCFPVVSFDSLIYINFASTCAGTSPTSSSYSSCWNSPSTCMTLEMNR